MKVSLEIKILYKWKEWEKSVIEAGSERAVKKKSEREIFKYWIIQNKDRNNKKRTKLT